MTAAPVSTRATHVAPARLSAVGLLRSETIKLLTLRSTWWSIGVVAVLSVLLALLIASTLSASIGASAAAGEDAFQVAGIVAVLGPTQFTMLLAGALGAIAVTGEYSTGMIRSTLTAEPRRGAVLAAKAVVVGALLFLASVLIFAISVAIVAPIAADAGAAIDWQDPTQSLLPLLYGALSMSAYALIGLSCGFLLRSGPGAIALTVGILFILPILPSLFAAAPGWEWVADVARYLPMNAGQALMSPGMELGLDDASAGTALVAWVAVGLAGSWAVLRTRDA
ncbi:ABC transporter permease [Microbacterium sp. 18062]|uniref:ABC transporter permease n=1 Tax=Microbacterium sp. 18062 TaxID=2681410 RepID=UPI001356D24A|nr:ABC transporter permease [Microbacterium sp. 18062]